MARWDIFTGTDTPRAVEFPPAPPWRRFGRVGDADGPELPVTTEQWDAALTFQVSPEIVDAVNAALVLRRPLLLTGRPGSGKSSLIECVSRELRLGRVLRWHVTSRSALVDALYRYDAIGRLHSHGLRRDHDGAESADIPNIEDYIRFGPLGTALLPSSRPRALLIDEIDKGEIDLPNDLLTVFERGEFEVPELARLGRGPVNVRVDGGDEVYPVENGHVRCKEFPFVVLTSNGERDFPPAFLRRCIRLQMPDPTVTLLTDIVTAHLGPQAASECESLIRDFAKRAEGDRAYATDQLLNAIFLVSGEAAADPIERTRMTELLLKKLASDVP